LKGNVHFCIVSNFIVLVGTFKCFHFRWSSNGEGSVQEKPDMNAAGDSISGIFRCSDTQQSPDRKLLSTEKEALLDSGRALISPLESYLQNETFKTSNNNNVKLISYNNSRSVTDWSAKAGGSNRQNSCATSQISSSNNQISCSNNQTSCSDSQISCLTNQTSCSDSQISCSDSRISCSPHQNNVPNSINGSCVLQGKPICDSSNSSYVSCGSYNSDTSFPFMDGPEEFFSDIRLESDFYADFSVLDTFNALDQPSVGYILPGSR
jgi:hypothetical protein